MRRVWTSVVLPIALLAASNGAAGEPVEVFIGGATAQIEMPEGFCALSAFEAADARLIRFLIAKNRNLNTIHLAFGDCAQVEDLRSGGSDILHDYGFIATPIVLENTPVNMSRPDYVQSLATSMSNQGILQLRLGPKEGEKRAQKIVPELAIGDTENTGVLAKDDNALYLGLVQKLRAGTGDPIILIGASANTVLNNRVTTMHLYTEFSDDVLAGLVANNKKMVQRTIATNQP